MTIYRGRKFYYGDEVVITSKNYTNHIGHHGIVVWTHPAHGKRRTTVYEVECDCNELLRLPPSFMDLYKERAVTEVISVADRQKRLFVRQLKLKPNKEHIDRQIEEILSGLPSRYKLVIVDRYGLGCQGATKTQTEIGEKMGVSKQRVEQIEKTAIKKIKAKVSA